MEWLKTLLASSKDAPRYVRVILCVLVAALVAFSLYFGVSCGTVSRKSFCSPDGCFVFTDSIGVTSPYKRYLNY